MCLCSLAPIPIVEVMEALGHVQELQHGLQDMLEDQSPTYDDPENHQNWTHKSALSAITVFFVVRL